MVYVTTVTIAVTNEAQPVSATRVPCSWVTLQGDLNNASGSPVYHGPPDVTSSSGQAISGGGGGGSPQYPPVGDTSIYDLSRIYIVGVANDSVRVMYAKR